MGLRKVGWVHEFSALCAEGADCASKFVVHKGEQR